MMRIIKAVVVSLTVLIAACLLLAGYVWFEVEVPKVVSVHLLSDKIRGEDVRMVQISDVHGKKIDEGLFIKIKDFDPDVVIITGDLVDRSTNVFEGVFSDVGRLSEIAPVFFVTGNHDIANPGFKSLSLGLSDIGVTTLKNSHVVLKNGDSRFILAGVDFGRSDVLKAIGGGDADLYTVLLAHSPSVSLGIKNGVDLVISGHTHGGQVRLPFFGAVLLPDIGIDKRLIKGVAVLENGMTVYTDSGYGTSVIPVRFMDRSEISLITVSGNKK
ncbi:MAG: metallophosphoesterase [Candidatus Colwellbacteria bacterium]|nr:metallophosphoesterase [Candidatus Colwellbacteria bacterium]